MASAFNVGGTKLERFYHHWFTSDKEIIALIEELGCMDQIQFNPTNTGIYLANKLFKLSTPLDLLCFTPLSFFDRIRLGLLAIRAKRVKDWKVLENKTAAEWLTELGGENVYRVVWEPLLSGKFGPMADRISAVWFWNKLKLRGGSRGKGGEERLAYFRGGFSALIETLCNSIRTHGGTLQAGWGVDSINPQNGRWILRTQSGLVEADAVIATTALPVISEMVGNWASPDYTSQLNRIEYLANVCLVLELDRRLSSTYWMNVNDPSFPFVGIIEHTNFVKPETYSGKHIVYLSKYLLPTDSLYLMNKNEILEFATPHIQRMFPDFKREWVLEHHIWKARWAQPIVEKGYSLLIPSNEGPRPGFFVSSMAQIYPEDRGTNYAVKEGRKIGKLALDYIQKN